MVGDDCKPAPPGKIPSIACANRHNQIYDNSVYILRVFSKHIWRRDIHKKDFLNIVYMKFELRRGIQEKNYTRKNYFLNCVYKNRGWKLIF